MVGYRNFRFMLADLTDRMWQSYDELGYVKLGPVLDASDLDALQRRMTDIMLGRTGFPGLQFQLDTGGAYEDLPDPVSNRPMDTLLYRKIQGLEADPLVREIIQRPLFRSICARHYGRHASISIFRAMMMNKPAGQGTHLPWHQDGGDVWRLDRDPLVTIWIAIDPATRENGCIEIIPRSHRLGLLSHHGSTVSADNVDRHCPADAVEFLEVGAGEGLLLHNWLLHRSDVNRTGEPRRALTACYMDGRTRNTLTGDTFPLVFGDAVAPWPFLEALADETRAARQTAEEASRYATSLVDHAARLEDTRREAERYALSLERELKQRSAGDGH